MSDQRRFLWWSGRLASAPIRDFWQISTTVQDPSIPNLPLETPSGGGGGPSNLDISYTDATDTVAASITGAENVVISYTDAVDTVAMVVAGAQNVVISYTDGNDVASSAVTGTQNVVISFTDETDTVAATVVGTQNVAVSYVDAVDTVTAEVVGAQTISISYTDAQDSVSMEISAGSAPPIVVTPTGGGGGSNLRTKYWWEYARELAAQEKPIVRRQAKPPKKIEKPEVEPTLLRDLFLERLAMVQAAAAILRASRVEVSPETKLTPIEVSEEPLVVFEEPEPALEPETFVEEKKPPIKELATVASIAFALMEYNDE